MKSIKFLNLLITTAILILMLGACESEVPEACQDINFTAEANSDSTDYTLIANLNGLEDIEFSWFVNDRLVASSDSLGATFDFSFAPGTYQVCVNAESAECGNIDFCQEITVKGEKESDCPELAFTSDRKDGGKYLFKAEFRGMDSLEYVWYVDGDSIESERLQGERHHKFDYHFRPGDHTVCIIAKTERCGVLEFCKEISVEAPTCPTVSFSKEADGEFAYLFTAEFEAKDSIQYKWYVNGDFVDKENFEGHETDHKLYWQFEPGTHEVCLKSLETDHCEQSVFCKEIVIEGETSQCPDLYFEYSVTDNGTYEFTADFEGQSELEWYGWFVNGESVEDEGIAIGGDHMFSLNVEAGASYEVCLKTETENCPEGVSYCKTISIDGEQCVDLSYTAEEESNGYIFTANFDEKDNVNYIWKVYKNDDYQGGEVREAGSDDDHDFFWQFEPGIEYTICLRQEGCENNTICEKFIID